MSAWASRNNNVYCTKKWTLPPAKFASLSIKTCFPFLLKENCLWSQPHGREDEKVGEIRRNTQRPFHRQIQKSEFVAEFITELSGCKEWAPFQL